METGTVASLVHMQNYMWRSGPRCIRWVGCPHLLTPVDARVEILLLPAQALLDKGITLSALQQHLGKEDGTKYFGEQAYRVAAKPFSTTYVPAGMVPILLNTATVGFEKGQLFCNVVSIPLLSVALCSTMKKNMQDAVRQWNTDYMSRNSENAESEESLSKFSRSLVEATR